VNRDARAEKQSARCDPTRERVKSSADFPLHPAAAWEQTRTFLHEPIAGPGAAYRASFGVIDLIH
jgi:hypothetical protein